MTPRVARAGWQLSSPAPAGAAGSLGSCAVALLAAAAALGAAAAGAARRLRQEGAAAPAGAGRRRREPDGRCWTDEDAGVSAPFAYRDGELCAEAVPLDEIARGGRHARLRLCRRPHARRSCGGSSGAFAGQPVMLCYALKANSNLAVIRTLADEGAGAEIVSGGELQRALAAGVPPRPDRVLGRRQEPRRDGHGARGRDRPVQRRIGAGAGRARRGRRGPPAARAGRAADQSRRRRRHPRQDQHRPPPGQVRHRLRPGARGLPAGAAAGRDRGGRAASAHRLADPEPGAVRGGLPPRHRAGPAAARRGHRRAPARSRRRPRRRAIAASRSSTSPATPRWCATSAAASISSWCSSRAAVWSPRPGCCSAACCTSRRARSGPA